MRLTGKVAIISGAASGMGAATARRFGKEGARVVIADMLEEEGKAVADGVNEAGGKAMFMALNVTDEAGWKKVVDATVAAFGRLDILVNNAAITRDGLAIRMKLDDWDAVLRTNLTGAHLCAQQALAVMLRQRSGRIINVTSVVAETGNAGQSNYVAAKAGLIGLTRALAVEVASRNITVNAVAPGFIVSPMTDPLSDTVKQALLERIPLGRMGTDADVTTAIVFLSSDEAGYITGAVLDVNGGLRMG